jgi:hypothetical protein
MMVRACLLRAGSLLRIRFLHFAGLALLAASFFSPQVSAQSSRDSSSSSASAAPIAPTANPGRPTVSTPATLTPVGYLQFETGMLSAGTSPEFSSQTSVGEVMKIAVIPRLQLLLGAQPYAYSRLNGAGGADAGDVTLGAQAVVHQGEDVNPTIALSCFGRVYSGSAPDLDIGSAKNSALLLVSADVHGFHYDTNFIFNEQVNALVRRAQFGQTLSIAHPLAGKFGLSGEIWRFTQPFLRGNAVGNLWAVNYNASRELVFDGGFNRGLTNTSTRWEVFVGFTYLLPHRIFGR